MTLPLCCIADVKHLQLAAELSILQWCK